MFTFTFILVCILFSVPSLHVYNLVSVLFLVVPIQLDLNLKRIFYSSVTTTTLELVVVPSM